MAVNPVFKMVPPYDERVIGQMEEKSGKGQLARVGEISGPLVQLSPSCRLAAGGPGQPAGSEPAQQPVNGQKNTDP